MGNITKKEIKKMLKNVRDELEEAIADKGDQQNSGGESVDVDIKIEVVEEVPPIPLPIALAKGESNAITHCFWFCYTIDGVRTCRLFC